MRVLEAQEGQSMVELVAIAPVVLLCGLLGLQALAAGANYVVADNAAHAGALAARLGRSPRAAALDATPGWSRGDLQVSTRSRVVRVRLTPRAIVPPLAPLLSVESRAAVGGR